MRPLREIIVHCSATRPSWMAGLGVEAKVEEIREWHTTPPRNWSDIGYHYIIDRDGATTTGRPMERTGAHVKGRNKGSIGICLIGGHGSSEKDEFADNFTPEQDAALRQLINALIAEHGAMAVVGHNQFAAKACPGFYVPTWWEGRSVKRAIEAPKEVEALVADAAKPEAISTTNWGAVLGILGSGYAWWQSADVSTQVLLGAVIVMFLWIMRERIRKVKLGKVAKEALGALQ